MRGGGSKAMRYGVVALVILCGALVGQPRFARGEEGTQVLLNHDLSKGSEGQPDSWQTDAWVNDPATVAFKWTHQPNGGPGELEVNAMKEDDARWKEPLQLQPGWYHVTAEIKTENVGTQKTGANISLLEDGITSPDIKGTSDWTKVGFFLKLGKAADVEIALRVGGFSNMNTGRAFFRSPSVERVPTPPPNSAPVFDLDAIRKQSGPTPIGSPISLVLTYVVLFAMAYGGWYLLGLQPPKVTRAEARRSAAATKRPERPKKVSRR